ncbi:17569_t:CDS:2, partial [Acaulospora colombiana]
DRAAPALYVSAIRHNLSMFPSRSSSLLCSARSDYWPYQLGLRPKDGYIASITVYDGYRMSFMNTGIGSSSIHPSNSSVTSRDGSFQRSANLGDASFADLILTAILRMGCLSLMVLMEGAVLPHHPSSIDTTDPSAPWKREISQIVLLCRRIPYELQKMTSRKWAMFPIRPSHLGAPSEPNASTTNTGEGATTAAAPGEGLAKLRGANRFRQLAWKVVEKEREQTPSRGNTAMSQARATTILSDAAKRRDTNEGKGTEAQIKPGRLTALRPSLKRLQVTHTILDHTALVRHLQFSPNGKLLATCGWDGTARLFDVPMDANDVVGRHRIMAASGGFLGQVAWSPD